MKVVGVRPSESAKKILELAEVEADKSKNAYVGSEHVLLGIIRERECVAAKILRDMGITYLEVVRRIGNYG